MTIEKLAKDRKSFSRRFLARGNARAAFKEYLRAAGAGDTGRVLLPGYIGWSAREGSGVFDPISETGAAYEFYRLDERLRIDLDDVERRLRAGGVGVLVLIHYFGYIDRGYARAVALARKYGARVLEDEAHAMLSDLIGGRCGRLGDAATYSLHKLLPVPSGAVLVLNPHASIGIDGDSDPAELWRHDLAGISLRRRENALALHRLLDEIDTKAVEPLWPEPAVHEVPQTLPVLIHSVSRDRLYEEMNRAGFGVVSLYHTLIKQIERESFPESHRISQCILNLPVHQDATSEQLEEMVGQLARFVQA